MNLCFPCFTPKGVLFPLFIFFSVSAEVSSQLPFRLVNYVFRTYCTLWQFMAECVERQNQMGDARSISDESQMNAHSLVFSLSSCS